MSISRSSWRNRRGRVAALLLALVVSALAPWPAPVAEGSIPIAGNGLTLPPGARAIGPLPANRPLHLIVGLAPRHAAILEAFARLRAQRGSPFYGQPLSAARFADLFSPSVGDQHAIVAYLRGYGLRITRTYADRLLLDASGTAGQVAAAFDVPLVYYRSRSGDVRYANARAPRLPARLVALVSSVIGLRDDVAPHHAPAPRLAPAAARPRPHVLWRAPPAPPPSLVTPAQIQAAYDITPIYSQVFTSTTGVSATAAITGGGETIALYELSPYDPNDIAAFDAAFGITASIPVNVPVDGGAIDAFDGQGTGEAALDIELLQAIAPGARILVYNGPSSPSSNDNTGLDDTYARIVNDNLAQVLSTSWGLCEDSQQADQPPDFTLLHNLFAQAVAQGMSVVAASGDDGANDCLTASGAVDTSKLGVDYPASDPNVIAVGGTTLSLNGDGSVASETSWSGSGGGLSKYFKRPDWQSGPGVTNSQSNGMRQVPDVALNAGDSYAVWEAGGWRPLTGTSAGPPVWAALLALTNQARYVAAQMQGAPAPLPCAALPGLGDIHSELYQLAATPSSPPALRDIVSGPGNGFAAPGPGWDYVTGVGVPDAYALLRALIAMPTLTAPSPGPCPSVTPGAGPTSTPIASRTPTSPTPTSTATRRVPQPSPTPSPTKAPRLKVSATPGRVWVGGIETLELSGIGVGRHVTFELRYPGQKPRRVNWVSGKRGKAVIHVRVPETLSMRRSIVVWLRVTEQGNPVVGWASFRILPAPTRIGGNGGKTPMPASSRQHPSAAHTHAPRERGVSARARVTSG